MLTRITKATAKKRFSKGEVIYFCPCKMKPGFPWNMAAVIHAREYLEKADWYKDNETLWKGTREATAWHLAYNNWVHYNASYETGYYAHFYIEN